MSMHKFTSEVIAAAIEGFEAQKRHIDEQIAELRQLQAPAASEATSRTPRKRKRRMSAAGRKAIADATRKRWAAVRAAKDKAAALPMKSTSKKVAVKKAAAKTARAA